MIKRTSRCRQRRRPVAEINVVPYIDVMLVLLVIFMVTAPLITLGVKVELPEEQAGAISAQSSESIVITVDSFGDFYVDAGSDKHLPVDEATLRERIRAVLSHRPETPVLVRGDRAVDYGSVVRAMVVAQAAGAPQVGLMTAPLESGER